MLLGYALTLAYLVSFLGFICALVLARKEVYSALKGRVNRYSIAALVAICAFFISFSLLYVHPVEQLYFDENIYQGIALNILHNFNSLWCQYGSAYAASCPSSVVYHDSVEWSFYVAMAFALLGTSVKSAFALTLFTGLVSIIAVFALSSLLLGRRGAVASTLAFALFPELFIWSRVEISPDLALMCFATVAVFCFAVFNRSRKTSTLVLFGFSLMIAAYMRIEGMLLIPLFLIAYMLYGEWSRREISSRLRALLNSANDPKLMTILLAFLLILIPQLFYLSYQISNPQYGQGSSNQLFSFANMYSNGKANLLFLAGSYDQPSDYPALFPWVVSLLAVAGACILAFDRKIQGRKAILAMLLLWFIAFFLFYGFFYAGSAIYGVDVRFMLELQPSIAILAGVFVARSSEYAGAIRIGRGRNRNGFYLGLGVFAAIAIIALVYPFTGYIKEITIPPTAMPQQHVIYPALQFVYDNYSAVPNNCLVFSFTPDVWYEQNRSAAQIGLLGGGDQQFKDFESQYSCYVLDYGYWCVVPPNHAGLCSSLLSSYSMQSLSSRNISGAEGDNVSLYLIKNYSVG